MPSVAANDLIRVVSRLAAGAGLDIQNSWHFIVRAAMTHAATDFRDEIQGWLDGVFNNIIGHISSNLDPVDLKIDRVVWNAAKQRADIAENLYFGPWTMATPPSSGGEMLPSQTTPIINLRTARPQTVGRRYMPPFTEAENVSAGNISPAALANLALSGAAQLVSPSFAEGNWDPGVVSPYSGADPHFWEFTSATPAGLFMTQRRRTVGRGS